MARKSRRSSTDDPFGPVDLRLLDLIRGQDAIIRAALCTFARRGVAFRQTEPDRAAKWLDRLSTHPLYKAGQFLFDLLEWEDFMLDGPPPPLLDSSEAIAILTRITNALSSIYADSANPESIVEPVPPIALESPPDLEAGFYLYRDVVLGALSYALQNPVVGGRPS